MGELRITMLGTGSAFPSHGYNTCMVFRSADMLWLVDAGGGNGVLGRLNECGFSAAEIDTMFITHTHTDHILGAVWVIRAWLNAESDGCTRRRRLYGNADVIEAVTTICRLTLLASHFRRFTELVELHTVSAGDEISEGRTRVRFVDCGSENVAQTGLNVCLPSGRRVVCLGDEALTPRNAGVCRNADMVMCGAFCRYADRDVFRPYEKHHLTVRDVAATAAEAGIGTLVLYHSEDRTPNRARLYKEEAAESFGGNVIIPSPGDVITV